MSRVLDFSGLLLQGAGVTVALALLSLALATLLGMLGAWAKLGGGAIARGVAGGYTGLIRGIPDLVLIMLIYFGGQRLLNTALTAMGVPTVEVSPFASGVLSIGLIYGAYLTETFRGAWLGIPNGQFDAAKALGLPRGVTFREVLLPQLTRNALSGYSNVWQVLVKSTAVVSVIGLKDMVYWADKVGKTERMTFTFMLTVLIFYLLLTLVSENVFRWMERRADRWAT